MSRGYTGKILWVNLSNGEIAGKVWDEGLGRRFIGGGGLAAKMVWDETDSTTEPFSADNPLIFITGPVTATRVPTSGRYNIASLSPLTGKWGQAHAGGTWGFALKLAGWDAAGEKRKRRFAVSHAILIMAYHMLTNHVPYQELGPDYFDRSNETYIKHNFIKRLESLGYEVTLKPLAASVA